MSTRLPSPPLPHARVALRSATRALALTLTMLGALATPARAEPPSPIEPTLFAFPGQMPSPPNARSASVALADRWLGEGPYANPSGVQRLEVELSPALVRMSRQDLRAGNRHYDETPAFLDGAGGSLSVPWRGTGLWLYGYQSALRLEDNAFERGPSGSIPAVITSHSELREVRVGVAASRPLGGLRLGLGVEWNRRQDLYESSEQSGSPESGTRHVDFDGAGLGGQAGVRYASGDSTRGSFALGAGLRFVPSLTLDGTQELNLLVGDSTTAVSVERASGWEGGVSGAMWLSSDFRVLASVGGRTAQDWEAFGVSSGPGFEWHLGGEYHDAMDPWTFRFGIGQEQQTGVPEPRAGSFALGFGWSLEGTVIDLGAMRRTIDRANKPHSFDDRVLVSARVNF